MQDFDVIGRIKDLCQVRSWTYYRLAKESGITYSTLNSMLTRLHAPSIQTLSRICDGFGVTLAQFFDDEHESIPLTQEQKQLLERWEHLNETGKGLASAYMAGLLDMQNGKAHSAK